MAKRRIYEPINQSKYSGRTPIVLKSSWEETFARTVCDINPSCVDWCYDDQTEILTQEGWLKFANLPKPCKVATLNPTTHHLEYHEVEKYQVFPYDGEMVSIQNRLIDLVVTPNHRMYAKFCRDTKHPKENEYWDFVLASDITGNHRIKRNCIWDGEEVFYYQFEDYRIEMDIWLEFLGYYIAEGCAGSYTKGCYSTISGIKKRTDLNHLVQISQHQSDKIGKIQSCLDKLPFRNHYYGGSFHIQNKALVDLLVPLGKSNQKVIPEYAKNLSSRQLKILIDALIFGDGCTGSSGGEMKYFTSSKQLADDVQEIALKTGYASSIKIDDRRGREVYIEGRGVCGHTNYISYIVAIHRKQLESYIGNDNISRTYYSGNVYCVTVPNHIVYVRRNGKCAWSGQCYEPWRIPYRDPVSGRQTIYIPDFLMSYRSTEGAIVNALVEIKPAHQAFQENARNKVDSAHVARNLAKWEAARAWCERRRNVKFVVITEKELFAGGQTKPRKRQIKPYAIRRVKK